MHRGVGRDQEMGDPARLAYYRSVAEEPGPPQVSVLIEDRSLQIAGRHDA
jgi:hypothetical protein